MATEITFVVGMLLPVVLAAMMAVLLTDFIAVFVDEIMGAFNGRSDDDLHTS